MSNKQVTIPTLAGVGQFVEENFYKLGSATTRPALNRLASKDPNSSMTEGGITGRDDDAFKFRADARQLKTPVVLPQRLVKSVRDVCSTSTPCAAKRTVRHAST